MVKTCICAGKFALDIIRKRTYPEGYRQYSPDSRFPKRKNLRGRDEALAFLANLDFTPNVYFFDSPESGFRVLAEGLRQKGTLVYFEPEGKDEESN